MYLVWISRAIVECFGYIIHILRVPNRPNEQMNDNDPLRKVGIRTKAQWMSWLRQYHPDKYAPHDAKEKEFITRVIESYMKRRFEDGHVEWLPRGVPGAPKRSAQTRPPHTEPYPDDFGPPPGYSATRDYGYTGNFGRAPTRPQCEKVIYDKARKCERRCKKQSCVGSKYCNAHVYNNDDDLQEERERRAKAAEQKSRYRRQREDERRQARRKQADERREAARQRQKLAAEKRAEEQRMKAAREAAAKVNPPAVLKRALEHLDGLLQQKKDLDMNIDAARGAVKRARREAGLD
jgi:hypothetical protein